MKVIEAILNNPRTFGPADPPRTGVARVIFDKLRTLHGATGDFPFPAGCTGIDHQIIVGTLSTPAAGGYYQLRFNLAGGLTFTTGDIRFNTDAAGIQKLVDVAAAGIVPRYAAGDIVVSGGPISQSNLTFDYTGVSVGFADQGSVDFLSGSLFNAPGIQGVTTPTEGDGSTDEIQVWPGFTESVVGGHYRLKFNLAGAVTFTTEPIAFDAGGEALQSAIDTAATGVVAGYGIEHISIVQNEGGTQFEFIGSSVSKTDQGTTEVLDVDLQGSAAMGPSGGDSTTGQAGRVGFGLLIALEIAQIALPEAVGGSLALSDVTPLTTGDGNQFPHGLDADTVRSICLETSIEEGNDDYYTVLTAKLGL